MQSQPDVDRSTGAETQTSRLSTAGSDLRAFQVNCLAAICRLEARGAKCHGLGIKRELEDYYGEDVNHGRLYPNLDNLVEAGLVDKSTIDRRTNAYELTAEGAGVLDARQRYLDDALDALLDSEEVSVDD